MPQQGLIVRALIASPADVLQERQVIPEVIAAWNASNSLARSAVIEPVKWELHAVPGLEGRPQAMINEQLVERCDFLIGVFWTRLGTRTGVAESGTVEEIEQFRSAGKPVLLYFCYRPVEPSSIDAVQIKRLVTFRTAMEKEGLVEKYHDVAELQEKLSRHLTATIERIQKTYVSRMDAEPSRHHTPAVARIEFLERLDIFNRRFGAEWSTERESEPVSLEGARQVLREAIHYLLTFISSSPPEFDPTLAPRLEAIIKRLKVLERQQLSMRDSREDFWSQGDQIVHDFDELVTSAAATSAG